MNTIAVFVNDAAHAKAVLEPRLSQAPAAQWIVVACAPRMTRRIGKWTAQSSRDQWRQKWCQRLFDAVRPLFAAVGAADVRLEIAKEPPVAVLEALRRRHGDTLQAVDARCHRLGAPEQALSQREEDPAWALPLAVSSGLGLVLALAD